MKPRSPNPTPAQSSGKKTETVKLAPLRLLNDEPIAGFADDRLGLRQYAEVVASAALGTPGPFTIGVYAGWGQGKTSLLNQARTLLEQEEYRSRVVTVHFNAWRYEGDVQPLVPLVVTIERAVQARLDEGKGKSEKVWEGTRAFLGEAGRAMKALAAGLTLKGEAFGIGGVELSGKDALEALKQDESTLGKAKWEKWVDQCLALSAFDRLEDAWTTAFSANGRMPEALPRVVVFIDDLDRCQPEKAFVLLEQIKLVLAQRGFVFVLALNEAVIGTYLEQQSARRYGDTNKHLGGRYLDKIVQLPIPLRSHQENFQAFVQATLEDRLTHALDADGRKVFLDAGKLMAITCRYTPRTFIRRVNTLLLDQRLRPQEGLEGKLGEEKVPYPLFFMLCFVQRTLKDVLGDKLSLLSEDQQLCALLASHRTSGVRTFLLERERGPAAEPKEPVHSQGPEGKQDAPDAERRTYWVAIVALLRSEPAIDDLLSSEGGRLWLTDTSCRRAVQDFVVRRPDQKSEEVEAAESRPCDARAPLVDQEQQQRILERCALESLGLDPRAPFSNEFWARVVSLDLRAEPIDDTGLHLLARPEFRLKSLASLNLWGTQVTDVGLKELSRADTGLKSLASLNLSATQVTDVGLKELSRADTGLKSLASVNLWGTRVTDVGLKELSRSDTGLKSLASLNLFGTQVTDVGLKDLSRADTGLKSLASLNLGGTRVTDVGLKDLSRADTGLKSLANLDLPATQVTDVGLKDLSRADTGLKSLASLDLGGTRVTDVGLKDLSRADTGLKSLASLNLGGTRVTDVGLKDLSRADTGLKSLASLNLWETRVTDVGLKDLSRADTGLKSLASLNLGGTRVTNAGLKDLSRANTRLKSLRDVVLPNARSMRLRS